MDKDTIVNQVVNKAYYNLIGIVDVRATAIGGYFGMIIPESQFKGLANYCDEIINNLYKRLCNYLSNKITNDDMESITYKSFCCNDPKKELIKDCFEIVNSDIEHKQNSNKTSTLLESLTSLQSKYNEKDVSKSLDTIFDIILDYYSIIKK